MKRIFTIAMAIASLLTIGSQSAYAHAQLAASNPSRNQIVTAMPNLVWLEFDGDLMEFGGKEVNTIKVTDSSNKRVDIGGSFVGGPRLSTRVKTILKPGRYLVSYRIVSEDGHPVEGKFYFTYRPSA